MITEKSLLSRAKKKKPKGVQQKKEEKITKNIRHKLVTLAYFFPSLFLDDFHILQVEEWSLRSFVTTIPILLMLEKNIQVIVNSVVK